jgi:hypothetical protein
MKITSLVFLSFILTIGAVAESSIFKPLDVLKAFRSVGLDAQNPVEMEPKDYGFAPVVGEEAYRFGVPSVCDDCNGRIFSVTNTGERGKLKKYYDDLGKQSGALFSWTFERSNILVQLNGDMKKATAMKYKTVLDSLK